MQHWQLVLLTSLIGRLIRFVIHVIVHPVRGGLKTFLTQCLICNYAAKATNGANKREDALKARLDTLPFEAGRERSEGHGSL